VAEEGEKIMLRPARLDIGFWEEALVTACRFIVF